MLFIYLFSYTHKTEIYGLFVYLFIYLYFETTFAKLKVILTLAWKMKPACEALVFFQS